MISGSAMLAELLPRFRIAALGCWLSSPIGKLAYARVVGDKKTDAVLENSVVEAPPSLASETHSHNPVKRCGVFVGKGGLVTLVAVATQGTQNTLLKDKLPESAPGVPAAAFSHGATSLDAGTGTDAFPCLLVLASLSFCQISLVITSPRVL